MLLLFVSKIKDHVAVTAELDLEVRYVGAVNRCGAVGPVNVICRHTVSTMGPISVWHVPESQTVGRRWMVSRLKSRYPQALTTIPSPHTSATTQTKYGISWNSTANR